MREACRINIFYKYTTVRKPVDFREGLKGVCTALDLKGRVIVATEGINGTLEGTESNVTKFEELVHEQDGTPATYGDFSDMWFKHSKSVGNAFPRLSIKTRPEIVSLRLPGGRDVDPRKTTGTHISAEELHAMFQRDEDFTIIDMRNNYEHRIGRFDKSVEPETANFYELPEKVKNLTHLKNTKVITVCTYGVRCEKASAFLKSVGFKDVSQLHGGIGTYLKKYPKEHFKGSLYVFDKRMREQFANDYEVISTCARCHAPSEHIVNCSNGVCHKQHVQCEECIKSLGGPFCNEKCEASAMRTVT